MPKNNSEPATPRTVPAVTRVDSREYRVLTLQSAALAALRNLKAEKKAWNSAHDVKKRKCENLLERLGVVQADRGQLELWDDATELSPELNDLLNL